MIEFKFPRKTLGELDSAEVAHLLATTSDIALVLDAKGVVRDVALSSRELEGLDSAAWVGKALADLVAPDSRQKVEQLLRAEDQAEYPRWRQVNHPLPQGGGDLPIIYTTVALGTGRNRRIVAAGRELVSVSRIQQRLIEAQYSLERDHSRLRSVETRYRLLLQTVPDPVLVIDATTQRVVEANQAAATLFAPTGRSLLGQPFPFGLAKASTTSVQAMLSEMKTSGRATQCSVRLFNDKTDWTLHASTLRADSGALTLLRLVSVDAAPARPAIRGRIDETTLANALTHAADAFVVTSTQGRILGANHAFVEMCQVSGEDQLIGQGLDRWLGREGVDLNVLTANLRQNGAVKLFATKIQTEQGASTEVEISASTLVEGDSTLYTFSMRDIGRRLAVEPVGAREIPRSVEQIAELVGRVALKDLVREATDAIERLCIEAALELTRDNRASAAEVLGLSRQSLYVKLRRYGLAEMADDSVR
ncbi:MAG: transcriptional regulator PpsR [Lautropia sp.]